MAKSTRSKIMRTHRRTKREDSVFAIAHAARLERLSQKLSAIAVPTSVPKPINGEQGDEADSREERLMDDQEPTVGAGETMDVDAKKVSTHGRSLNRRQEWRASKGLPLHKKSGKVNRQGAPTAARNAGRSHRRR